MRRHSAVTGIIVGGGLLLAAAPGAHADAENPEELPDPTREQLAGSVHVWTTEDLAGSVGVWRMEAIASSVHVWSLAGSVSELETVETDGDETTISLATDILFPSNSWDLPPTAAGRIEELSGGIPDGAQVVVNGHTDSTPTGQNFDNQELSEKRAEAVADVLRQNRPDVTLEVAGLADDEPAEAEDPEDPSTFAANRRVEIVYQEQS